MPDEGTSGGVIVEPFNRCVSIATEDRITEMNHPLKEIFEPL